MVNDQKKKYGMKIWINRKRPHRSKMRENEDLGEKKVFVRTGTRYKKMSRTGVINHLQKPVFFHFTVDPSFMNIMRAD